MPWPADSEYKDMSRISLVRDQAEKWCDVEASAVPEMKFLHLSVGASRDKLMFFEIGTCSIVGQPRGYRPSHTEGHTRACTRVIHIDIHSLQSRLLKAQGRRAQLHAWSSTNLVARVPRPEMSYHV